MINLTTRERIHGYKHFYLRLSFSQHALLCDTFVKVEDEVLYFLSHRHSGLDLKINVPGFSVPLSAEYLDAEVGPCLVSLIKENGYVGIDSSWTAAYDEGDDIVCEFTLECPETALSIQ